MYKYAPWRFLYSVICVWNLFAGNLPLYVTLQMHGAIENLKEVPSRYAPDRMPLYAAYNLLLMTFHDENLKWEALAANEFYLLIFVSQCLLINIYILYIASYVWTPIEPNQSVKSPKWLVSQQITYSYMSA